MGGVEAGKDAGLAVWSGDPFSNPTLCEKTIVDGEAYDNFENGLDWKKAPSPAGMGTADTKGSARTS
ncbi:MAG: hypothetical protein SOY64_01905 [Pyramidobacter sp.]|uniref:hypothetical protein n=1 Tax=Pyramidobacter sp. TaxID=1943581 RepID=UPI002A7EEE54|nr:hypothetical protein [Pyramidobacter sp.]MDY4031808.1 hypothetical protein [Pyramidobacter sp.]